ncbi:MAG: outer membrane beta-barrel protein [Chitinophagaceae bacterium]|nr:outer membrane beta-barrel protein [Chitinophagaceae bacterium]
MKRVYVFILGAVLFSASGFAQKGNNQVGVAAELGLPTGDFGDFSKAGIGGSVKGLYGIGKAGQITLTTGILSFRAKSEFEEALEADKITQTVIPILAGYRHNFSGFYAEPQVGYGIYGAKIKGGIFDSKDSEGAFTWAIGVGYVVKGFEVGARYQSGHKDGDSNALIGFRVGYNFSLSGNK